jgi:hypothetical protein
MLCKRKSKRTQSAGGFVKGETFPDFKALQQVMRKEIRYGQQLEKSKKS